VLSAILSNCAYITGEAIEISVPPPPVAKDITPEEANMMLMASSFFIIVIDVRTPEEYTGGYIDNAINVDFNSDNFSDEINRFDQDKIYLIYCRSGKRSAAASNVMAKLGFKNIYNMTGGILAWEATGLPIVK
jgi:rhodanese-related sulfurtransferase